MWETESPKDNFQITLRREQMAFILNTLKILAALLVMYKRPYVVLLWHPEASSNNKVHVSF